MLLPVLHLSTRLLPAVLNVKYQEYDSAAAAAAAACGSVGGSAGDSAGRERRPGCEQGHCTKLRRVFAVCPTPYPNLGVCCPELGGLLPQPLLRKSLCSALICANVCLSSFSRSVKLRRDLLASKG